MGRFALLILTALSVLGHALFGCCTHRAHAMETPAAARHSENIRDESPASTATCSHHSSHPLAGDPHEDEGDSTPDSDPCEGSHPSAPHGHCHESTCDFPSVRSAPSVSLSESVVSAIPPTLAGTGTVVVPTAIDLREAGPSGLFPESLRAHLYLCVLRN